MRGRNATIRVAQVLLTIVSFEFFGPIVRDYSPSHAFNPTWVGHARVHLVWLLAFMGFSGLANLWLVWFRRPFAVQNLWLSVVWQCCNLGGFWVAYALVDSYEGLITIPDTHIHIFGWDENVFAFAVLSVVMAVTIALLARVGGAERARAAH
jgi:hypothetical protein